MMNFKRFFINVKIFSFVSSLARLN